MTTKAKNITPAEWAEIAQVPAVREAWGLEDKDGITGAEFSNWVYGAKFDFVSGGPGYVGDLFTLMGDGLSAPPMVLIRDLNNNLIEAEF